MGTGILELHKGVCDRRNSSNSSKFI